jgi:uncharacterized protein YsxB (DUF464 family)
MKTILEIKPMQGLGELKFGASREDVKALLGEPDETETIDVEGEIHEVEVWSYFDQGHSIYFEKDLDNVCTNFETENEDALLFGKKVFELDKDAIIALMKENNFTEFEIEDDAELEEVIVFFDEAHMQFVFENDQLGLVSWAVALGDDDEILWP